MKSAFLDTMTIGTEFKYVGNSWGPARGHTFRVMKHVTYDEIVVKATSEGFSGHSGASGDYLDTSRQSYYFFAENLKDMKIISPAAVNPNSQAGIVLGHLLKGGALTRISADHLYRVASLTKVISALKQKGHNIVSRRKYDLTGRPYHEYSLPARRKVA